MERRLMCCDEYERVYESGYEEKLYEVGDFYGEESELDETELDESEFDESELDESELEDEILEEIPFVYCPSMGEVGEA